MLASGKFLEGRGHGVQRSSLSASARLRDGGACARRALTRNSFAQPTSLPSGCVQNLIATAGTLQHGYAVRQGYCDGTVPINNSAELQVVSYTAGLVQFSPTQPQLVLKSAVPLAGGAQLLGMDKRASGSYRLDGVLPAGGLPVNLQSAVHPKGIAQTDLGLLAWKNQGGDKVFVPLDAGAAAADRAKAVLVLRAPIPVVQAAYEICDEASACTPQKLLAQQAPAGALLSVELPQGPKPRRLSVRVTVLGPGNDLSGQVVQVEVH